MQRRVVFSVAIAAFALAGCATATGDVAGGEARFDAAPAPLQLPPTMGSDADVCGSDAGGATFTDLYRDLFGPTGAASCQGNGNCHGTTSGMGYAGSEYLCPPSNAAACYTGLTNPAAGLLTPGDGKPFNETVLYVTLRKASTCGLSGGGTMPKSPPYTYEFSAADIARITDWVAAGAKND